MFSILVVSPAASAVEAVAEVFTQLQTSRGADAGEALPVSSKHGVGSIVLVLAIYNALAAATWSLEGYAL